MLNIKLALKFIFKKPIQYLFVLFVVTIGVAIFYFVYNASAALKRVVLRATAETGSYISVKGDFPFTSYDDLSVSEFRSEVFANDSRIKDISYTLYVPAVLNRLHLNTNETIIVKGLDFTEGGNIQEISKRIPRAKHPKTLDENSEYFGEIAIGNRLAINLGYLDVDNAVGKPIKIDLLVDEFTKETYVFKIVAVYYTDQLEMSEKMAFTTIETLHKINNFKNKANVIEISTTNPLNSDAVAYKLNNSLEKHYSNYALTNWQEGNKYIVNALYIEDVSIVLIQVFTAIAIAFGLSSIITFIVRERNQQIGILKALGITNLQITLIFLYQIILILILGILIGLYLGDYIAQVFMQVFRRPNSDAPLVALTLGIKNSFAYQTALIMFISSVVAAFVPLRLANKYKIIEIIKGE